MLPNAKQLNDALNEEFEALVSKLSDYYELKKQLVEAKKSDLVKKYEHSVLLLRYKQLKKDLESQRRSWNSLVAQYA